MIDMNKIFIFKKTYSGLNYDIITVNIPLTVKICSFYPNQNEMDDNKHSIIENLIEETVKEELFQRNIDGIYYHTFDFLKDIWHKLNVNLEEYKYYIVDLYIGDEVITDDANYISNINKYFENTKH